MKRHLALGRRTLGFILLNFATPIAFFVLFQKSGAKSAITLAVGVTCAQLAVHGFRRIKISPFLIVASGFTLLFGTLDLFLNEPRYFRLEPFAQSFILSLVFAISSFTESPIAAWFASSLPASIRPDLGEETHRYLKRVTLAWAVYFFLKALFFLYLAFSVNLGELILLRSVLGGASLVAMFVGELVYRKWFRGKGFRKSGLQI